MSNLKHKVLAALESLAIDVGTEISEGRYSIPVTPARLCDMIGATYEQFKFVVIDIKLLVKEGRILNWSDRHVTLSLAPNTTPPSQPSPKEKYRMSADEVQELATTFGEDAYCIIQAHRAWCFYNGIKPHI